MGKWRSCPFLTWRLTWIMLVFVAPVATQLRKGKKGLGFCLVIARKSHMTFSLV